MGRLARVWLTAGLALALLVGQVPAAAFRPILGSSTAAAAGESGTASPSTLSYGNVMVGASSQGQVTLTNTGPSAWISTSFSVAGANAGDWTASGCSSIVAPAGTCVVSVTFAPQGSGARAGSLTITTNSVTVIRAVALSGTGVLGVGASPRSVAVNASTHRAYVANSGSATVSVVDVGATAGAAIIAATVTVGTTPFGVAVNPTTNKIYVTNQGSNSVSVIDGATNTVATTIAVGSGPTAAAANPITNTVYIGNNSGGGNTVSVIDGATGAVTSTITVPGHFVSGVAINASTGRLYVTTNQLPEALHVVDAASGSVITTVALAGGSNPSGVAVNERTNQIWVSTSSGATVINGDTNTIAYSVVTAAHDDIALNPLANRTYLGTDSSTVSVVDGALRTADALPAGGHSSGVGVDTATGFIVTSQYSAGTVAIISEPAAAFAPRVVVNSAADSAPCCVDDGTVTLREAMSYASGAAVGTLDRRQISGGTVGRASKDTVRFDATVFAAGSAPVIAVQSALPVLSGGDSVIGNSGGGVVINGAATGGVCPSSCVDGLSVSGPGAVIAFVTVENFSGRGVMLANSTAGGLSSSAIFHNGSTGVELYNANQASVAGNTIGSNGQYGVYVGSSSGVSITGNSIGTGSDGQNFSNGNDGVRLINGTNGTRLFGNVIKNNAGHGVAVNLNSTGNSVEGGLISRNTGDGVNVDGIGSTGNAVLAQTRITANAGKGISLLNGANAGIKPPQITGVSGGGTRLVVQGTALPNASVSIYSDPADEGATYLASVVAASDGTWLNATWSATTDLIALNTALKAGVLTIRAIQRDTAANSSEFSATAPLVGLVSGVARCGDTLMAGAKVTVYSGTAVVASTTADSRGAYQFAGLAVGAYTITFSTGYTTCGGPFVVDGTGGATIAAPKLPIDFHNHAWPVAYRLDPIAAAGLAVTTQEHLYRQGQSAWFKFSVKPGGKVIVTLTGLPANYDLTLYKNIPTYAAALTSPRALLQAAADFAPDAFSPDAFSPDAFSPDAFSPDAFSPDAFSPDAFSPDAFSPDAFSPDAFSPDAFSPDAFSPDAYSPDAFSPDAFSPDAFSPDAFSPDAYSAEGITPDAYSGAQTKALIAVSAFNGTSSEGIIRNTWENDQDFYVRVRGRNGAFSLAAPFTLKVIELTGSCASVAPVATPSTITASAGTYKTVILTDRTRAPFSTASATDLATLDARLATYAARPEVAGVIVNVGLDAKVHDANVQANANPTCPYAKNQVAYAVKDIVSKYWLLNSLQYVVLVGNDEAIPSFRQPDEAGLANERTFYPPMRDSSPSQANLRLGYLLGQDRYGSRTEISYGDHSFPLPELAVGRLVEKPTEITSVLDAYLLTAAGVTPVTTPSLVTGYDFMADAAAAIRTELELGTGRPADALIELGSLPPTDPSAWTAGQLRALYLGSRHDVSFLGAHFSPATMLAADYTTRFLASELATSALDLRNAIVFSIGCHAGFNQVDAHDVPTVTREPDFAQAAAIKGMALIANQGYGYGDTDTIEYDERLNLLFSQELRRGTGPVSIGQALVRAKVAYLAATPQMRAIHEKTIVQKTLFGLPQLSVDMPGTRLPASSDASIVTSAGAVLVNPGAALGLRTADTSITPSLSSHTVTLANTTSGGLAVTATYLSGSSGIVVNPAEPVLPLESRNVTLGSPAGTVLRGVGFRGGAFSDLPGIVPLTGAPATELRGVHAPFVSNVLYPIRFWAVNYLDALRDGGQTRLNVFPAQFMSDAAGSASGTLRQFSGPQSFRLFYSGWTGASANASGPSILRVSAVPNGGNVDFAVNVAGLPAAGIQNVWVTYTATTGPLANQWQSLDLGQVGGSTLWTNPLPLGTTAATDIRFMVQAVNGVGLVTLATNQGSYYVPGPDTVLPALPKQATSVTFVGTPAPSGIYREQATFTARAMSGAVPLAGRTLTFGIGSERRQATTGATGTATAVIALLQTPGDYEVRVSFDETADLLGSFAPSPFTIAKRATALSIAPACTPMLVTLRDTSTGGRTLRDQTVMFEATAGTQTFRSYDITDFAGRARLTDALPTGSYSVAATFGAVTDVGGGVTATQTNDRYGSSAAVTSLAINPANTTVTYAGGTLVAAGTGLTATSTVASDRDLTGAVVCFVVRDNGASVAVTSAPVDLATGTSSVTIAGLPTGVYTITATVVGGGVNTVFSSASAPVLVAVYDANAGFVTGGGWISSPPGADPADPSLTGRANFGFVSKYQKGASVPVGNTEFQFQLAGLRFKSTAYQWLVISGARAQYKGTGTINGAGRYGFLVTAIDGQVNGGGGTDKFRIKIWDGNGAIVYDNQIGAADDSDPTTVISGGSIVVQK